MPATLTVTLADTWASQWTSKHDVATSAMRGVVRPDVDSAAEEHPHDRTRATSRQPAHRYCEYPDGVGNMLNRPPDSPSGTWNAATSDEQQRSWCDDRQQTTLTDYGNHFSITPLHCVLSDERYTRDECRYAARYRIDSQSRPRNLLQRNDAPTCKATAPRYRREWRTIGATTMSD